MTSWLGKGWPLRVALWLWAPVLCLAIWPTVWDVLPRVPFEPYPQNGYEWYSYFGNPVLLGGQGIEAWDWKKPAAVFIGNEGSGLSTDELGYCDTVLRIPHRTTVESLNSAIAAAVVLYEAFKQRRR